MSKFVQHRILHFKLFTYIHSDVVSHSKRIDKIALYIHFVCAFLWWNRKSQISLIVLIKRLYEPIPLSFMTKSVAIWPDGFSLHIFSLLIFWSRTLANVLAGLSPSSWSLQFPPLPLRRRLVWSWSCERSWRRTFKPSSPTSGRTPMTTHFSDASTPNARSTDAPRLGGEPLRLKLRVKWTPLRSARVSDQPEERRPKTRLKRTQVKRRTSIIV